MQMNERKSGVEFRSPSPLSQNHCRNLVMAVSI
jgi:hypothetical protein